MRRMVALLLTLALCISLTLTGCGSKGIVGTWKGQVNLTGVLTELWDASMKDFPAIRDEMPVEDVPVYITMEFREDGTCRIDLDDASLEKCFAQTSERMKTIVKSHLDKALESSEYANVLAGIFNVPGRSLRDLLDFLIEKIYGPTMQQAILAGLEREGNYLEEDGMLYISNSTDVDARLDRPNPYQLERNRLTIESRVICGGEYGDVRVPLVLERA